MTKIDLIKSRLSKLQGKGNGNSDGVDYAAIFWKPKLGKQVVRIVPSKKNPEFPFAEVSFHEYKIFKKSVYSLENFGEKDPIKQLVRELYNENTEDSKELAKKISPRTKYYANVIVRGEEQLGCRLWELNKTTYEKLLSIMAEEDFGDIDDVKEGTDLSVEGYNDTIKIGNRDVNFIAVNITPKRNTSKLSDDPKLVESYIENQKDILEIFKRYSYDEIKQILREYLNPSNEDSSKSSEEDVEETPQAAVPETAPEKKSAPKSTKDKFNSLFDDDDSSIPF
jgi:hypothetical protein